MKLLIKQRVFSWTDSYDVYDENENAKYFVKAEFLSLGHRLHVYDMAGNELGLIKEKVMSLLPVFEIEVNGQTLGRIEKRFTLFRPKYDVEFNGWHVEGDFMGWNYDIYEACSPVVHITKELLHWGDTYVLDFANPADELMGLLLVITIDAADCIQNNLCNLMKCKKSQKKLKKHLPNRLVCDKILFVDAEVSEWQTS